MTECHSLALEVSRTADFRIRLDGFTALKEQGGTIWCRKYARPNLERAPLLLFEFSL